MFYALDLAGSLYNGTLNETSSLNMSTPSSPHSFPNPPPPPTPYNGPDYSSSSFLLFGIIGEIPLSILTAWHQCFATLHTISTESRKISKLPMCLDPNGSPTNQLSLHGFSDLFEPPSWRMLASSTCVLDVFAAEK